MGVVIWQTKIFCVCHIRALVIFGPDVTSRKLFTSLFCPRMSDSDFSFNVLQLCLETWFNVFKKFSLLLSARKSRSVACFTEIDSLPPILKSKRFYPLNKKMDFTKFIVNGDNSGLKKYKEDGGDLNVVSFILTESLFIFHDVFFILFHLAFLFLF